MAQILGRFDGERIEMTPCTSLRIIFKEGDLYTWDVPSTKI